jgi:hypothetical protein
LPAIASEASYYLAVFADKRAHFVVRAVHVHQEALRRIDPEIEIPHRAREQRLLGDEELLHEGAVLAEDLDAVVGSVADVHQAIFRNLDAVYGVGELLRRRPVRVVGWLLGIARRLAIGAPMPFVSTSVGIEHDDAVIAVAVGDEHFVSGGIDLSVGRAAETRRISAAGLRAGLPICSTNLPSCVNFRT